nr:5014_t:CDS:2 [Entrophospora candida]
MKDGSNEMKFPVSWTIVIRQSSYSVFLSYFFALLAGLREAEQDFNGYSARWPSTILGHRKYFKDVDKFWNQIERCHAEFEASSSIMEDTTEAFKTSVASVNFSIKNVNNTMLKYNEEIKSVKSIRQNSENSELDDYDSPIHKDELKSVRSVLGKRWNSESSDYDSSTESDGNQSPCEIVKKNQMNQKIIQNVSKNAPPSLISIMQEYCKKNLTSKFDPAHSYILDLSPRSKIAKEFASEYWTNLIADHPNFLVDKNLEELQDILEAPPDSDEEWIIKTNLTPQSISRIKRYSINEESPNQTLLLAFEDSLI